MIAAADRALLRVLAIPVSLLCVLLGFLSLALILRADTASAAVWACFRSGATAWHMAVAPAVLVLLGVVLIGLSGLFARWRDGGAQFIDAVEAERGTYQAAPSSEVALLLRRLGIEERTRFFIEDQPVAFVRGFLRPTICLSTGLIAVLTPEELEAVVLHERWHALRRDPLRLALVQSLTYPLRARPGVQEIVFQHSLALEVAADKHAVQTMRSTRGVASALLRLITCHEQRSVAAFSSLIDVRVAILAGEVPMPDEPLPLGRTMLLAAGAIGSLFMTICLSGAILLTC
jgi:Zn-dependent protease with chaperone function